MHESEIEKYLVRKVRRADGEALKFVSPGMSGVPDRIVMMPGGRIYFVELKSPGKKPRKLQTAVHKVFERLGHRVAVLDSKAGVDEWLKGVGANGI